MLQAVYNWTYTKVYETDNIQSAHTGLINLAKKLGYKANDDGLCYGVTLRCLEAYLLGLQDNFIKRINKIINEEEVDLKIQEVQEKVKWREDLSQHGVELLEIRPFFDSLFLYHLPHDYTDILKQNFWQSKIDQISLFAGSEDI